MKRSNLFMLAIIVLTCCVIDKDTLITLVNKIPGSYTNPDTNRNLFEIIKSRGFDYESHFVTSQDGYILHMVRLVSPYVQNRTELKPVLLFHGFVCSAVVYLIAANGTLMKDGNYYEYDDDNNLITDPNHVGNSLGFVLAAKGYDVWLANYRGGFLSTNHTNIDPDSSQFWSFSIDEMIEIDLPDMIHYIQHETNKKTVGFIGHSQANFMMLALLSIKPEFSEVVKPFISLSPVFYMQNSETLLRHFSPIHYVLRHLKTDFPKVHTLVTILANLCENNYLYQLCYVTYNQITGTYEKDLLTNRLGVYLANVPQRASAMNAAQIFHMLDHGNPTYFDMGSAELNFKKYGQDSAPLYNASKITSNDLILFYTKHDWFNHMTSVNNLKRDLKVKLRGDYMVGDDQWNHMQLVWAKDVGKEVNTKVLKHLGEYD